MNPSAPSFKPAGGLPTPAIEGPTAAGTPAVDASLAIVPPRERQVGVVDHRVTPEALARLEAMNTPVPIDRMSTTSAVNSDEAMPYGPTLNMGFSQYNTQQHLHVSLDRSAEVAAVAEARHAELMTKKDAQFVERLGAIQANAQAEYARLGKELDVSNQTIINQQREFAARMGYGQQQLDEAITTAIQAQKQNHDLQVSLVRAQAKAEEEAAKSDAIRRQMEAEAKFKDESMQKELDSMRQALEDMRAQIQSAPGGGAASALLSDLGRPPPTFMGPSPGREAPGPSEEEMPPAEVPIIPIFTPPGLGPKPKDDGPPDDDDDDGSDKDKHKKDKKYKKDKKRRKKKKRSSSSSSSSSDSSQVGKQMLKAIMKQLKKGSKKDKKSDDEGTDGEKPKNKAKEAEKITFPKFPLPEQYRNWRIRVREAVVAASDKPDMAFEWLSKVWAKESTEEQLRDPEGFVTLDAKVLSAITNVLEGEFARQTDTFKEREANAGRPVRGRQVLFRLNDHFATNALHGSVYDLEDLLAITLANENLVVFLSNWETVLSGIQKAPDETFLEPLFYRQVKKCKALQHDINIYERAADGSPEKTYKFLYDAARNHINRKRLERNRERIAKQTAGLPTTPAPKRVPKGFCIAFVRNGSCNKGESCKYKHEIPQQRGRSNTPSGGRGRSPGGRAHSGSQPRKHECKFFKVGKCDRGDKCRFVHKSQPSVPAPSGAESGGSSRGRKDKKQKKKKKDRMKSKSSSRSSRSSRSSKSSKGSRGQRAQARVRKPLFQLQLVF